MYPVLAYHQPLLCDSFQCWCSHWQLGFRFHFKCPFLCLPIFNALLKFLTLSTLNNKYTLNNEPTEPFPTFRNNSPIFTQLSLGCFWNLFISTLSSSLSDNRFKARTCINLVFCAMKFAAECTWISHSIYTQQTVYFFHNSELSAWSYEWVLLQVNGGRLEPKPAPNWLVQYGTKC